MKRSVFAAAALTVGLLGLTAFAGQTVPDETAPAMFKAKFDASGGGAFVITVHRAWAPIGADHFYTLVKNGFYDEARFFRVIPTFMVQFGIAGDPAVQTKFKGTLKDDPVKESNKRGFVTFAKTSAPNSRSTQIFINYADNSRLDRDQFAPFGEVTGGMDVVDKINAEYGGAPSNDQGSIQTEGNTFLKAKYPKLDYVKKATIQ